jgi:hypothetical protein
VRRAGESAGARLLQGPREIIAPAPLSFRAPPVRPHSSLALVLVAHRRGAASGAGFTHHVYVIGQEAVAGGAPWSRRSKNQGRSGAAQAASRQGEGGPQHLLTLQATTAPLSSPGPKTRTAVGVPPSSPQFFVSFAIWLVPQVVHVRLWGFHTCGQTRRGVRESCTATSAPVGGRCSAQCSGRLARLLPLPALPSPCGTPYRPGCRCRTCSWGGRRWHCSVLGRRAGGSRQGRSCSSHPAEAPESCWDCTLRAGVWRGCAVVAGRSCTSRRGERPPSPLRHAWPLQRRPLPAPLRPCSGAPNNPPWRARSPQAPSGSSVAFTPHAAQVRVDSSNPRAASSHLQVCSPDCVALVPAGQAGQTASENQLPPLPAAHPGGWDPVGGGGEGGVHPAGALRRRQRRRALCGRPPSPHAPHAMRPVIRS